MVDVQTLEVVAHALQLRESTVTDGPVWQHPTEGREDAQRLAGPNGIGREEGRHHHIGTVGIDIGKRARGIGILSLHTLLELRQQGTERIKGTGLIAVACITDTSQ